MRYNFCIVLSSRERTRYGCKVTQSSSYAKAAPPEVSTLLFFSIDNTTAAQHMSSLPSNGQYTSNTSRMNGPDLATAKLAAELQLEDVERVLSGMEAEDDDEYQAFTAMQIAFKKIIQAYEDQLVALSLLRLEYDTRVECERLMSEERQALRDHNLARELVGLDARGEDSLLSRANKDDEEYANLCSGEGVTPLIFPDNIVGSMEQMFGLQIDIQTPSCVEENFGRNSFGTSTSILQEPTPATPGPSKGRRKEDFEFEGDKYLASPTHGRCSACLESYPRFDLVELTCKREGDVTYHCYCRECLIGLFDASITDTTLFPPRCCGKEIPLSAGAHIFSSELIKKHEEKQAELATSNPVYCSNRSCAQFIKPQDIMADVAICSACFSKTCAVCKGPSHQGLCPKDPTVQLLMNVADEKKWQRCHGCRTMVELIMGCYHMR